MRIIVKTFVLACFVLAVSDCKKTPAAAADAATEASVKAPVAHLPAPFSEIRLGMSRTELEAKFAPDEDISKCDFRLIGGDAKLPKQVPGAEKQTHSLCARSVEIGGVTFSEVDAISKKTGAEAQDGALLTLAQLRGAVRAGAVPETAIALADDGKSTTVFDASSSLSEALYKGGVAFATAKSSRREVCALITTECDGIDPTRLRTYTEGGYSLGQIDADAHSRVVNGKCRYPYLQNENRIAMKLVANSGGLGGIGLARASRADHLLAPEDASSFSVYTSRSHLDPKVAKLGVLVANALPATEAYWRGAVTLQPVDGTRNGWLSAVVWLRDDKIVRVLLNVLTDDKLGELPEALATVYGSKGTTRSTVTTWSLADGVTAKLDIGAAVALTVERAGTPPTAAGTATAPSAGTLGTAAPDTSSTATAAAPPPTAATASTASARVAPVATGLGAAVPAPTAANTAPSGPPTECAAAVLMKERGKVNEAETLRIKCLEKGGKDPFAAK